MILACLLQAPERCETFRLPFQDSMRMAQCAWQSQFAAARWAGEHPAWQVRKFSCEAPPA